MDIKGKMRFADFIKNTLQTGVVMWHLFRDIGLFSRASL